MLGSVLPLQKLYSVAAPPAKSPRVIQGWPAIE